MKENDFIDLAIECGEYSSLGVKITDREHYSVLEVIVDSQEKAELFGKPQGTYFTLLFSEVEALDADGMAEISDIASEKIIGLLPKKNSLKLLVAGLGNGEIVFDSLGSRTCKKIHPEASDKIRLLPYEVGVEGKSGIDTLSIVRALVTATSADAVIAVDSLVARGRERLGRVIQISDSGICAASGVGRHKSRIDLESVGVPVIAVGAPLALNLSGFLAVNEQVENSAEAFAAIICNSISKIKPKTE